MKAKREEIDGALDAATAARIACKEAYINELTDEAWDAVMVAEELYNVARCNRDVSMGYVGGVR
jgi:hypothetical protein